MAENGSGSRRSRDVVAVVASMMVDVLASAAVASEFALDNGERFSTFALATYCLAPVALLVGIFLTLTPVRGSRQTGKAIILGGTLAAVLGMVVMLAGQALS